MNPIAIVFVSIASAALLFLPRKVATVPLLTAACYMTLAQMMHLGPLSFPIVRILIAVGFLRILLRREGLANGFNGMDRLMVTLAVVAIATSYFHKDPYAQFIFCGGLAYNTCGIYFLLRVLCRSIEEAVSIVQATACLLAPVAIEMLVEVSTHHNLFAVLGGVADTPEIRDGRVRAQGPFAHAILAGTVGAVCFPMMVGLWKLHRSFSVLGMAACLTMVITSASSGPLASVFAGLAALMMWRYRFQMRRARWGLVLTYGLLALVMKAPPYALMGRITLLGGSTGWHRVALIDAARAHLNEWWLTGTDYTRHWLPTGVSWSPDHTDITNYYLHLGVIGGLPLMLVFLLVLARAFSFVGGSIRHAELADKYRFITWSLGAALFAHAATCISVAYFDQSFLFLYLNLAVIGSTYSNLVSAQASQPAQPYEGRSLLSVRRGGRRSVAARDRRRWSRSGARMPVSQ